MTFKEFMDLYDNWNGYTKVNDNDLNEIIIGPTISIMDNHCELFDREVVAFGFYDDTLTVRIE